MAAAVERVVPISAELARIVLLASLWFVASYFSLLLPTETADYAPIRVGGALALGLLLRWRPTQVWPYLVAGLIALVISNVLGGRIDGLVWPVSAARVAEIGLAYYLLRRWDIDPVGLRTAKVLGQLLLIAAVVAPLPSAAFAGWVAAEEVGSPYWSAVFTWLVGNAFGMVVGLPTLLAYRPGRFTQLWAAGQGGANAAIVVLSLATTALAWLILAGPFVVLAVPLLLAAFRFGRFGTALLCAANMALVIALALGGLHADVPGLEPGQLGSSELALYCALSILGPVVVSIVLAERDLTREALFQEKELAQVTLESIGDAVVAVDAEEKIVYMNRVACDMTGWPLEHAIGRNMHEVVCIHDAETGDPAPAPLDRAMRDDKVLGLALNSLLVRRDGYTSAIEDSAAPIHDRAGRVIGGVMVFHDVSESRAMALKMSHLAQHDYLTDLPNRILLQDRLTQAMLHSQRAGTALATLFIDLDHFKRINDSLGHHVGDRLLQQVAARLRQVVRGDDTVSRQGGDEFVILLDRLKQQGDAARVAEKVIAALDQVFEVEEHHLYVSCSIGIAIYPHDGMDPPSLMRSADAAMYHAKKSGRRRFAFFAPEMNEQVTRRLMLETALRKAVVEGELQLYYQPKVARDASTICGLEALVRWHRPDGALVSPEEFISVAEEAGLIGEIDAWVMEEATRQVAAWRLAGIPLVPVAVNVSVLRLVGEDFLGAVDRALAASGVEGSMLQVEVTESQVLANDEGTRAIFTGLRARGIQIAIDDFGNGRASLSYLCGLPFDVLKIDRSFVAALPTDPRQALVVDAILGIAKALRFKVVAEGVETAAQANLLLRRGCDELQGFLFSKPVPAAQMSEMLRRGRLDGARAAARSPEPPRPASH